MNEQVNVIQHIVPKRKPPTRRANQALPVAVPTARILQSAEQRRSLSDENRRSQGELFLCRKWHEYNDIKRCVWAEFSGWHVCDSAWRLHKESSPEAGQGSLAAWKEQDEDFSNSDEDTQLEHEEIYFFF